MRFAASTLCCASRRSWYAPRPTPCLRKRARNPTNPSCLRECARNPLTPPRAILLCFSCFFFCLFLFLDQRLPGSVAVLGAAGVKRLQAHVEIIVRGLPDDLRRSLEAQAQAQAQATQEASAS